METQYMFIQTLPALPLSRDPRPLVECHNFRQIAIFQRTPGTQCDVCKDKGRCFICFSPITIMFLCFIFVQIVIRTYGHGRSSINKIFPLPLLFHPFCLSRAHFRIQNLQSFYYYFSFQSEIMFSLFFCVRKWNTKGVERRGDACRGSTKLLWKQAAVNSSLHSSHNHCCKIKITIISTLYCLPYARIFPFIVSFTMHQAGLSLHNINKWYSFLCSHHRDSSFKQIYISLKISNYIRKNVPFFYLHEHFSNGVRGLQSIHMFFSKRIEASLLSHYAGIKGRAAYPAL